MSGINIAYALLAGILPSILWLFFWLREDNLHPEPRLAIILTFLLGMISVALAIYFEGVSAAFLNGQTQQYVVWAIIEETVKALVVVVMALFSSQIEEPVDVMIFFLTAALGFAAVENSFFLLSSIAGPAASSSASVISIGGAHFALSGKVTSFINLGDFRFIGSTLVHTVSSAFVGFCVALAYYRSTLLKVLLGIVGIIGASLLHSAFNLSLLSMPTEDIIYVFAWMWCAVIIMMILFEEIKAVHPPHLSTSLKT